MMVPAPSLLLVDDRPENLLALEAILEPLGYELVTAGSAAEALRILLAGTTSRSSCSTSRCRAWTGSRPPR